MLIGMGCIPLLFTLPLWSGPTQPAAQERSLPKLPSWCTHTTSLSLAQQTARSSHTGGLDNFSVNLQSQWRLDSTDLKREHHAAFQLDLAYIYFSDSVWIKSADALEIRYEFIRKREHWDRNFEIQFDTQLLSDHESYSVDSIHQGTRWSGGFCDPFRLDLAYGTTWGFWKNCRINLLFVDLHMSLRPFHPEEEPAPPASFPFNNCLLESLYGCRLQSFVRHSFNKHIRWENSLNLFLYAVHPSAMQLDLRNKITFHLVRFLDLSIDTRLKYLPGALHEFQFRNEFLLAFTLEKP